jgi:TP901-1 family phage major tail protein
MAAKGGKLWLLKVEDSPAGSGTYTTIGGLRETSMSLSAEAIDATNHGSNQNKEILDGCGIKSMSLSGSGIFTDAQNLEDIEDAFHSQTLTRFQCIDNETGGRTYTALFKITSFERGGGYSAEQNYSISLESSGSVTTGTV